MGNNIYADYWRNKLTEITTLFDSGNAKFTVDVSDIQNFGEREFPPRPRLQRVRNG